MAIQRLKRGSLRVQGDCNEATDVQAQVFGLAVKVFVSTERLIVREMPYVVAMRCLTATDTPDVQQSRSWLDSSSPASSRQSFGNY